MTPVTISDVLTFDFSVIAEHVYDYQDRNKKTKKKSAKRKKGLPNAASLTTAMTSLELEDTIEGSSTLTVTIADPDFTYIAFFDIDENGRLDPIDVNYPLDSAMWWRLTMLDISDNLGYTELKATFMERGAVYMQHHFGPIKASRGKVTRAEFIKARCDEIKAGGGLRFHSKELHKKQPIVGSGTIPTPTMLTAANGGRPDTAGNPNVGGQLDTSTSTKDPATSSRGDRSDGGIHKDTNVTIKGKHATEKQLEQVNIVLGVGRDLDVNNLVMRALMCAGIQESVFTPQINSIGAGGLFQGAVSRSDMTNYFKAELDSLGSTSAEQAEAFCRGIKGFGNGGAIKMAHEDPGMSPGTIATKCEVSGDAPSVYDQWDEEGQALIKAGSGGFRGGSTYYRQQYNFQIGDEENPHTDYWTGCNDLADEVRWRFFIDGRDVYFDSDMTLIRQRPIAVIDRDDPAVISFSATWDEREIATEMNLRLVCEPFAFRAGDVFLLQDFGPLSTGSTTKPDPTPGRWLITDLTRSSDDPYSDFTLNQPLRPRREPRADIAEMAQQDQEDPGAGLAGVDSSMTPQQIINTLVLPLARNNHMITGIDPDKVVAANAAHGPTATGTRSDHQGPPDTAWAVDMSNGTAPTKEMDKLASQLIQAFNLPALGSPDATSGAHTENLVQATHSTFRYQLIYRTDNPIGHFNHVHFGVHIAAGPPSPGT